MREEQDFTSGSIFGKMMRFMIPILGALVLQALYGAVDLIVVGHFGTTEGISGVSTGSAIMMTLTFLVTEMSGGVMILIGRYLGEKKPDRIGKVIGNGVAFFGILSVIITILLVVFARDIAILMQAPEEALDVTTQYIRICGAGSIFIVFYNLISSIFRGLGNAKLPLIFVGIACVVNIIADLLFVAVFHLDVVGAALATILAQAVSVVLSLFIIRRQELPFHFSLKYIGLGGETKTIIKIGLPLALQDFLTSVSFLAINAFVNRLGLDASNGYGISQKVNSFIMMLPGALIQCMSSFVAQNVGAKQEDRARKGMFYGMGVGVAVGIFVTVLVFFKGDLVSSIFSDNGPAIAQSAAYLKGLALEPTITCILFAFMGYFNGHSKTGFVMIQGVASAFIIRLPLSYIMSIRENATLTSIGLTVPVATGAAIVACFVYYRWLQKEIKKNC